MTKNSGARPHRGNTECAVCHAKTLEYSITLSQSHVDALRRLYRAKGPVNLRSLGLTHTQLCTVQQLRYWDLIESVADPKTGMRRAGIWRITETGCAFIESRVAVPKTVWTYRKQLVDSDNEMIAVDDVRGQYADHPYQARAHAA